MIKLDDGDNTRDSRTVKLPEIICTVKLPEIIRLKPICAACNFCQKAQETDEVSHRTETYYTYSKSQLTSKYIRQVKYNVSFHLPGSNTEQHMCSQDTIFFSKGLPLKTQ